MQHLTTHCQRVLTNLYLWCLIQSKKIHQNFPKDSDFGNSKSLEIELVPTQTIVYWSLLTNLWAGFKGGSKLSLLKYTQNFVPMSPQTLECPFKAFYQTKFSNHRSVLMHTIYIWWWVHQRYYSQGSKIHIFFSYSLEK